MKLFLEYLTRKEREKAAKAGQTNLAPTGKEEKIVKAEPKANIPTWLKEFRRTDVWKRNKDAIHKNKIVDPVFRMVMTRDGIYYTCDIGKLIHIDLIGIMMKDGVIQPNENVMWNWHDSVPSNFIALAGWREDKVMVLSESYYGSVVQALNNDKKAVNMWSELIEKLGYELRIEAPEINMVDPFSSPPKKR